MTLLGFTMSLARLSSTLLLFELLIPEETEEPTDGAGEARGVIT